MATIGFRSPPVALCGSRPFSASPSSSRAPPARQHLALRVRFSSETEPDTAVAESTASLPPTESPVVTPKRRSSLISTANVQKALRGVPITDVDHYGRLGIPRGTSYEQVKVAYENKCEELMDKGLDEEETNNELRLLKESYSVLSSEDERRLYDWSLARSEKPDRYVWPFEVDITPKAPPPPERQRLPYLVVDPEPEDVGPTRLVGYFFLGWLILSFILSIALSR